MRRQTRIKKFQLLSFQVEKEKMKNEREKLQNDKEVLQNSRDFKEITLAITLLAGIGAILLSIIDYSAKHAINESFQGFVTMLVSILLFIFSMIFIFLILKGFLASQKNRYKKMEIITEELFKYIFLFSILWLVLLISTPILSFFENIIIKTIVQILLVIVILLIISFAHGIDLKEISAIIKREKRNDLDQIIGSFYQRFIFAAILIIYLMIFIVPQYLLLGSFSIQEIEPSERNNDIITFTIIETGMTYSSNYINLNKMNIDTNIFQYVDNITINKTQEALSQNKLMRGIMSEPGIWYLNVNTSNLSSGNYILHAEVTDDISKLSIFGKVKKNSDKLFYIAPRIENKT